MTKLNSILIMTLSILFMLTSCSTNENVTEGNTVIQDYTNNAENLVQASGIRNLKAKKATWQEFHQNYLDVTSKYKNHENLNSYTSGLIHHQIFKTSILNDINANNFNILESYLNDLKKLKSPYTKINYLIIDAMQPYVEKNILSEFAQVSYNKATNKQESAMQEINEMTELNDFEIQLKKKLLDNHQEEYNVFFPKLKEFFTPED